MLSAQRRPVRVALLTASPVYTRTNLYARVAAEPRIDLSVIFASTAGLRPAPIGYRDPVSWDVDLLGGYKATFLRRANINPVDGNFFAFRDLDVLSVLKTGNYDVLWLWGYNYLTHQLAAWSHLLRRRPVLFHENQTLIDHRPHWKELVKRIWLSSLFPRGRALFVGTESYRWFRHYQVQNDRLYFAPYAIDNERFQAEAAHLQMRKADLQRQFGISPGLGPVILTVSRLTPQKQPVLILEAFRRLRERRACALLVVGSGVLDGELKRRVRDQGIPDVHFTGFLNQSEIGRAYAAADIFVLASARRETWGLVVNEAMNFALPVVVSSRVGCAADLVRDGKNGYVVRPDDVEHLEERLEGLVASPERSAELGAESLRTIKDWNHDRAAVGVIEAIAASVGAKRWQEATDSIAQEGQH